MNDEAILSSLKKCRDLQRGMRLHAAMVQNRSIRVANALMHMYSKCGSMADARNVFEAMPHHTVVSWNVLILGYANNGEGDKALELFSQMGCEGFAPDALTFVAALKACTESTKEKKAQEKLEMGMAFHMHAVGNGCCSDVYLVSSLINMYGKLGSMIDAQTSFDQLQFPDVVAWTTLISGYAENGEGFTALEMFSSLESRGCRPNALTFIAALKACSGMLETGMAIHSRAIQDGCEDHVKVASTLVDMYARCGSLVDAHRSFERIQQPTVVPWTALILGCVENGEAALALQVFSRMKAQGCDPNARTFLAVLKACSMVGDLRYGRQLHAEILKHRCSDNAILMTRLIHFYCECGSMADAELAFESLVRKDLIAWNALLAGYSVHGDAERVFELFHGIRDAHLQLDGVTFLSVLTACSHAGLVDEGFEHFETMASKHGVGVQPSVEHYTCMADMLGRANRLDDAFALIKSMPFSPNEVTWTALLCACKKRKNVELGKLAFEALLSLDHDDDAGTYSLMANMYT